MTAKRSIVVTCDQPGCLASFSVNDASIYHARRFAWLERWSTARNGGTDYCPDHATAAQRGESKPSAPRDEVTGLFLKVDA